jgi:hypothetical protein
MVRVNEGAIPHYCCRATPNTGLKSPQKLLNGISGTMSSEGNYGDENCKHVETDCRCYIVNNIGISDVIGLFCQKKAQVVRFVLICALRFIWHFVTVMSAEYAQNIRSLWQTKRGRIILW